MFANTITYDTAGNFLFDATKVVVSAGSIKLLIAGGVYPTSNPVITTQHQILLSTLSGFTESSTLPANTSIGYQMVLNGNAYWYNVATAQWEASDGTFAKSNTAAAVNAHVSTLLTQTFQQAPVFFKMNVLLSSTDGVSTPILTSNTVTYQFTTPNPATINQCTVFSFLGNLAGAIPTYNPLMPVSLVIGSDHGFFHGQKFIAPFTQSAQFDSTGYCALNVIETTTPGQKLAIGITYYEGASLKMLKLYSAVVPNQPTCALSALSNAWIYDFG